MQQFLNADMELKYYSICRLETLKIAFLQENSYTCHRKYTLENKVGETVYDQLAIFSDIRNKLWSFLYRELMSCLPLLFCSVG